MSYNKRTWATGNVVGAVDLNRIENGIEDVDIDIDEIRGWSVQNTQLFSETVTTTHQGGMNGGVLSYSTLIDSASIVVTFNGTDYTCSRIEAFGDYFYGGFTEQGPDFSEYPFAIDSNAKHGNMIYTQTAGTFTVAVVGDSMQISTDFRNAVNTCVVPQVVVAVQNVTTWQAVYDAVSSGKIVCVAADEADYKTMRFVASIGISSDGNYHIETVAALNSAVEIANYYASSANDPIYPN